MKGLALLLVVPAMMWLSQSLLLWRAGLSIQWRINSASLPTAVKRLNRITTYVAFGVVLVAYPLVIGEPPWRYYVQFFPLQHRPLEFVHGLCAATLYLTLLYLAWLLTGNIDFRVRHSRKRLIRRTFTVPLTAVFVSFLEELLFRAVLLADLLHSFDTLAAVMLGAAVFAGAHYVRTVKRYWTIGGHLGLGLLLCVAFVLTRSLWLPMGLHAAGILLLMGSRPFIRYRGPAWLIGASIFPYAGVAGVAGLVLLTINLFVRYGA